MKPYGVIALVKFYTLRGYGEDGVRLVLEGSGAKFLEDWEATAQAVIEEFKRRHNIAIPSEED